MFSIDIEAQERTWFHGFVPTYNDANKLHEIIYDDEDEHCYFDLTQDLVMGDLIILHPQPDY